MTKQIIAVDVDDTIFDENTAIRLFMNDNCGFTHTEADYLVEGPFQNYWERIWKLDPKQTHEMYEEFIASSYKENLKPIAGALEVLRKLKENYELVIVTSRDHRTTELTHTALAKHYPAIFEDVHFTLLWGDSEIVTKAFICKEIGATYLVDDNLDHCQLAAEAGVTAILFGSYGWNSYQALPAAVIRCKSWNDVASILFPTKG